MKPASPLIAQIKAARRVSVPLVAITTPDPAATITTISDAVNGDAPKFVWDIVQGVRPQIETLPDTEGGQAESKRRMDTRKQILATVMGEDGDITIGNPVKLLEIAAKFPPNTMLFVHLANRWMPEPVFMQAAWNLRDAFKADRRMLVLLGPDMPLPPELTGDVVVFDEPLPSPKALEGIVREQYAAANLKADEKSLGGDGLPKAVEAIQGLPAFQAEQVVAMSLTKEGLDVPALWERKRRQIELTPGLKMIPRNETFDQIGGLSQVKQYLADLMRGNGRPNAITWLDEIDKALPGNTSDTSGVSQDQLGTILSFMEDNGVLGVLLIGPPGSGKSAVAKAAGNTMGVPTVRFDLGSCKGSLVGESENRIRNALKVITAVSNGKAMFIATGNTASNLDSALKRRFPFIFYFDLPTREEKDAIWSIWIKRFELKTAQKRPADEGWSAANIQKCAECAWRLGRSLVECQRYIVPCSRVSGKEIESLRKQADGVFLSASDEGTFQMDKLTATAQASPGKGRKLELED